jgi:hypothetical protein
MKKIRLNGKRGRFAMAGVKVRAAIEARWGDDQLKASASSAKELANLAVRLLVEDVGTEEARELIRDELGMYKADYGGAVVDQRPAKKEG